MGRQRSAFTALALAAAVMVGVSPYILGNASFQLSFLAMAGLVFLYPGFRNLGRKIVSHILGDSGVIASLVNMANDAFSATLAALIAVRPVIAYYFGIASLIAPIATFLALPALPGIIITGVITSILGFFLPVAQIVGWLAWLFLSYMITVASGLGGSPVASIEVASMTTPFIVAYYSLLALAIWLSSHWEKLSKAMSRVSTSLRSGTNTTVSLISGLPRKWVMPPLLAMAMLVSFGAATIPDDDLHVSFLDVGEGDAILIQQGNQQVLVDGGPSPQAIGLALGEEMPFWDRTIDLVVLTHPHADHITGLVEVLNRYKVRQVLSANLTLSCFIFIPYFNLTPPFLFFVKILSLFSS